MPKQIAEIERIAGDVLDAFYPGWESAAADGGGSRQRPPSRMAKGLARRWTLCSRA